MRRPLAVVTALAVTAILMLLSRHLLLAGGSPNEMNARRAVSPTALSLSASKADLRAGPDDSAYPASADYTLAVPAIDVNDGWQTSLQIQNTGDTPTSARIEFYAAAGAECPAIREPLAIQCVGPIPAGAARSFDVGDDPALAEARSAIVHSAHPDGGGCGMTTGEPLAVLVRRSYVDDDNALKMASGTYVGVAPAVAGFWDANQDAYVTVVPWVEASNSRQTVAHLQNIGLACAEGIELEIISGQGCLPTQERLPAIPPGQSLRIDLGDKAENDIRGSAWIRSPQPLAVAVDRRLEDGTLLSTHAAGREATHQTVDAPLILRGDDWNTSVRAQNASPRFNAMLGMVFRTSGMSQTLRSGIICPGGNVSVDAATDVQLSAPFSGTVTLQSQPLGPGLPEVPPLAADVDLLGVEGGAAYHVTSRITNTLSAPDIALPWLTRAYHPPAPSLSLTYTSRIAVMNQSEAGIGFVNLTFYDPDGSITTYQPEAALDPEAMQMIDLADVSVLPSGWHGSAILQFLSIQRDASVAVAVLETASEAGGDATTGYAGLVTQVQAQPTPTPSPTPTNTPTPTATPEPTATQPAPSPDTYLPLLRR